MGERDKLDCMDGWIKRNPGIVGAIIMLLLFLLLLVTATAFLSNGECLRQLEAREIEVGLITDGIVKENIKALNLFYDMEECGMDVGDFLGSEAVLYCCYIDLCGRRDEITDMKVESAAVYLAREGYACRGIDAMGRPCWYETKQDFELWLWCRNAGYFEWWLEEDENYGNEVYVADGVMFELCKEFKALERTEPSVGAYGGVCGVGLESNK